MSNKKLRYSEIFNSIQGEGLHVGTPSVFVRSFGCNFRCQGFGIDDFKGKTRYNPEVKHLIDSGKLDSIQTFHELPILSTGCDTYASIYPEFKHYMKHGDVDQVASEVLSVIPDVSKTHTHLILTGGEPMLWQDFWKDFLVHPSIKQFSEVTIETNGTQDLKTKFQDFLSSKRNFNITWSVSTKLSVSGESFEDTVKPDVIKSYLETMKNDDNFYFKFVVSDEQDLREIQSVLREYNIGDPVVYIMPVGSRHEDYSRNAKKIADLAIKYGYRYSPRLHCDIFGNAWGT